MKYRIVPAHYDGEKIVLDEDVYIETGAKLWVTIFSPEDIALYGDDREMIDASDPHAEIAELEKNTEN